MKTLPWTALLPVFSRAAGAILLFAALFPAPRPAAAAGRNKAPVVSYAVKINSADDWDLFVNDRLILIHRPQTSTITCFYAGSLNWCVRDGTNVLSLAAAAGPEGFRASSGRAPEVSVTLSTAELTPRGTDVPGSRRIFFNDSFRPAATNLPFVLAGTGLSLGDSRARPFELAPPAHFRFGYDLPSRRHMALLVGYLALLSLIGYSLVYSSHNRKIHFRIEYSEILLMIVAALGAALGMRLAMRKCGYKQHTLFDGLTIVLVVFHVFVLLYLVFRRSFPHLMDLLVSF